MSQSTRRRIVAASALGSLGMLITGRASAQESELPADLSGYLLALIGSVPDDAEGEQSVIDVLDAGRATRVRQATMTSASSYLKEMASNIRAIKESLVPDYALEFHDNAASEIEFFASMIDVSEPSDIADSLTITRFGLFLLLSGAKKAQA